MRGTKAKRLRTKERPNPGRKGGGATKAAVRESSRSVGQKVQDALRQLGVVK